MNCDTSADSHGPAFRHSAPRVGARKWAIGIALAAAAAGCGVDDKDLPVASPEPAQDPASVRPPAATAKSLPRAMIPTKRATATPLASAAPAAAPSGEPKAPLVAGKDAPAAPGMAPLPEDFEWRKFCMLPKLSSCTAYSTRYTRLDAVDRFCPQLDGQSTTGCTSEDLVARCLTDGGAVVMYYASGGKPYTKAAAEAGCVEKGWLPLP